MAREGTCYYKVVLNCDPCGRFVIIDRRPFENGRTYIVGCEECKVYIIFCSGNHLIGEKERNVVGRTLISFVRKA